MARQNRTRRILRIVEKIIIATDSFKGSLTSLEVAEAVCAAIRSTQPKVGTKVLAISDGGEGFAETVPLYFLEPNTRITINNTESNIYGDYII